VSVTLLMPGPTETPIFARAGQGDTRLGASDHKDDPANVARQGFEALMAGRERVAASSLTTKVNQLATRFLPDSVKARIGGFLSEPGSAR
jgi:short-subunit dehydrogenase